jgi:hypothetical protein
VHYEIRGPEGYGASGKSDADKADCAVQPVAATRDAFPRSEIKFLPAMIVTRVKLQAAIVKPDKRI